MSSIRRKLMRWLLIGQLLAVALTSVITFFYVRSELMVLFDDRLRQLAYSVPTVREQTISPPPLMKFQDEDDDDFVIQVWSQEGTLLLSSNREEGVPGLGKEGFSTHLSNEVLWRSFVLRRGDKLIQTSQPFTDRLEMTTEVAFGAISPVLALIVILGWVVLVSVGRGLLPLKELTTALSNRQPRSLAPLSTDNLPKELMPLVKELNSLLERLGEAMEGQRKFVADAAHALRTPLAAVQLQAQLLQRTNKEEDRLHAQAQILAGAVRAGQMVNRLLTLARMESDEWQRPFLTVDLSALMKSVIVDHSHAALERRIDLGVSHDEPLLIQGDLESLRIMLGNLIDNALRYTPRGGQIDVALKRSGQTAVLEVLDTGPGIPIAERQQVFDRFYRRPGTPESGSGLGLAIVHEVVTRHHGKITLAGRENFPGLKVSIILPLVSAGEA